MNARWSSRGTALYLALSCPILMGVAGSESPTSAENWHRYYDPSIGRYLQPEPLMSGAGAVATAAMTGTPLLPYAYGSNNPVGNVDANGLEPDIMIDAQGEPVSPHTPLQIKGVLRMLAVAAATAYGFATGGPEGAVIAGGSVGEWAWSATKKDVAMVAAVAAASKLAQGGQQPYAMRVQIQRGSDNLSSVAIASDTPITALQVERAMMQAAAELPAGERGLVPCAHGAASQLSKDVRGAVPGGGVEEAGNVFRRMLRGDPSVRFDIENLRGANLRTFK